MSEGVLLPMVTVVICSLRYRCKAGVNSKKYINICGNFIPSEDFVANCKSNIIFRPRKYSNDGVNVIDNQITNDTDSPRLRRQCCSYKIAILEIVRLSKVPSLLL